MEYPTTEQIRDFIDLIRRSTTPKTDRELVFELAAICLRLSERVDHLEKK